MKIYNEIIIDMNPESEGYANILLEDSYEYSGPLMKMDETEEGGDAEETFSGQGEWLDNWFSTHNYMPSQNHVDYTGEGAVTDYEGLKSYYSAYGRYGTGNDMINHDAEDGNAHKWHTNDADGWVSKQQKAKDVDPLTGIEITVYQVRSRGGFLEGYSNAGTLIRLVYPDGTTRYKK